MIIPIPALAHICLQMSIVYFHFVIAEVGKAAKKYIDNGELVPDSVMVDVIASELLRLKGNSWLLDG